MGMIKTPSPVKLFLGVLTALPEIVPEIEERLTRQFGPVDLRSEAFKFDLTHYYDMEMGTPIHRYFLAFDLLIAPGQIAAIKCATNEMEAGFATNKNGVSRPVNLDPGYIEESKIVLASTKNFYHRIFLAEGIYGEVTLHYRGGKWEAFPWSFPDFRSGRYDEFFTRLRRWYREQLRAATPGRI
jgi:hypothetical protein